MGAAVNVQNGLYVARVLQAPLLPTHVLARAVSMLISRHTSRPHFQVCNRLKAGPAYQYGVMESPLLPEAFVVVRDTERVALSPPRLPHTSMHLLLC